LQATSKAKDRDKERVRTRWTRISFGKRQEDSARNVP
jgi:hypothetical protein